MKRKIVIIGGGMAGLTAAFDLTRTQALRDRFDVTVYQLGWRLGGKAASSRDRYGRIIEHGLHVWFGCYENAFQLVRAAYGEWLPEQGQAITDFRDAFQPQTRTAMGSGDEAKFFRMNWPEFPGLPGDGMGPLTVWSCIVQMVEVIRRQYDDIEHVGASSLKSINISQDARALLSDPKVARAAAPAFRQSLERIATAEPAVAAPQVSVPESLRIASGWADALAKDPSACSESQLRGLVRHLRDISHTVAASPRFRDQPEGEFLNQLTDLGTAIIKGVILDMMIGGASVSELDRMDYREWLSANGAQRDSVYGSSIVHSLYDTTMQYRDGDPRRPSFGAGTAAQVSIRLFGSYKQAFLYESAAGLGEVVVTPLYRVLVGRNVKFTFFHKLARLELTPKRDRVAKIFLDRQADLESGRETYEPTIRPDPKFGNLECWPDAPLWDQIDKGKALEQEGADFESFWRQRKIGETLLKLGDDFDDVILAVPVGAFKPLNESEGPCEELIRASPRFRKMTEEASLVPSVSVQMWLGSSLAECGWPPSEIRQPRGIAAGFPTSTGPRPLNIWSDRTSVIKHEGWPKGSRPKSLQYLCDVLETSLHRAAPDKAHIPDEALLLAQQKAVEWLEWKSRLLWPLATVKGVFSWPVLFDREHREGPARLLGQIVKANVDPWLCCAGSPAGSTQWRLPAGGSGFANLFLAGAWIDSGFNAECIEAAVISGKQAARAVMGSTEPIVGEDFLHFERDLGALIVDLLREGEAVAEAVFRTVFTDSRGELERRAGRTRRQQGARAQ